MSRTIEIIDELKSLNLSAYPYEKAKSLIEQLFKFHTMVHILPKGTMVVRARVNESNISFREVDDLSFKPQKYNTKYQRASTPFQTVFYAGALPARTKFNDPRVIATLEASPLVRQITINKEINELDEVITETLTFGKWELTKDLPLIALCYHKNFIHKHPLTESLFKTFTYNLQTLSELEKEVAIKINDFFSLEFAKDKIDGDFDYLLSAIFTEVAISLGLAGVLYPSVRCEGDGFNIAVSPQFVKSHLRLVGASESKLYCKNKNFFINNNSFTVVNPGQKKFTFKSSVGRREYTDEKIIYAHLNNEIELPTRYKN